MKLDVNYPICKGDEPALRAQDFLKSLEGMTFEEALRATRLATFFLEQTLKKHSRECTLGEINLTEMNC